MAVLHGSKWWDVRRVLIAFLLVSASVASLENTEKKTTSASNEAKGVEANHHAKVFHKQTWPVRMFTSEIL